MKRFLVVLVLIVSLLAFSETFLLSPKSMNNPYWFAVENGMKDAAEALGVQAIFDAPIETDAAEQAQKIQSYIIRGVDGIGISPNDPEAIKFVIQQALNRDIPVITFDSDSPDSGRYVYLGTNNYNAGYISGELMGQLIDQYKPDKTTLNFAILTGGLAALNLNERIAGFKDAMEEYSQKTGKEIVYVADPFPAEDDTAKAVQILTDVNKRYPNLDGWFIANASAAYVPVDTMVNALGGMEKAESLLIVSFDTLPPQLELVKAGVWNGLVGQRPYDMGYLSLAILYNMSKLGVDKTLQLLPKVINEDGSFDYIIDTGVDIVTSENVDEFFEYANKVYTKR
ncbi:LacI family transcriptional regulator [Petrotoga sp. 9T1HF07.CasAA.8.2]|uniref:sugar-binding protein n=1 Tax=Petrotoga sp. 9T1HF07.CasAA.8.2 TaxID=1434329 RepID=UPI000CB2ACB3|nr:sugar-binding protein [Petrotoga sp. 9T1HF07.CasAA.8.2]PNR89492.1 LacI family transcriptional regulator [Petrotoga sp. 9T1HF07.CasAA.8.2]